MSRAQRRRMWMAALAVALAAFSPWGIGAGAKGKPPPPPPPPPPAPPATYSGEAQVIDVDLTLLQLLGGGIPIDVDLVKAGPLPSTGGFLHDHLLSIPNPLPPPLLLTAEVAHALTSGSGFDAESEAFVAAVNLGLPGLSIGVDVLTASSKAACSATTPGAVELTGRSTIANLVINGSPVLTVDVPPNTTIDLSPLAVITLNEQVESRGTGSGSIDVNALHIKLLPPSTILSDVVTGDVIISHAHSDIAGCTPTTPPGPCPVRDFITGGGYVTAPSGAKGTFGLHGGRKNDGTLFGHLNYIDHGQGGPHIQGTAVTSYTGTGTARTIAYNTPITADVADNGEPGVNDLFRLSSATYNVAQQKLIHGNIQLHQPRGCEVTTGGGGKPPRK